MNWLTLIVYLCPKAIPLAAIITVDQFSVIASQIYLCVGNKIFKFSGVVALNRLGTTYLRSDIK